MITKFYYLVNKLKVRNLNFEFEIPLPRVLVTLAAAATTATPGLLVSIFEIMMMAGAELEVGAKAP